MPRGSHAPSARRRPRHVASPARPRAPPRPAPRLPTAVSLLRHPSMRGEEEGEYADRQERGEKERDGALSMAKRLEQQPQESDIGGRGSLGEIEGAAPVKGEPHDQARPDKQRGEPHAPCVLLPEKSRDKRA